MPDGNPIDEALARYKDTQTQMLASSGGVGSTMAAAYSSVQSSYMTPNQAAMAGALPGYPSGMMTPTYVSQFRAPTPTPPPPVFAHPGVTSQFADAYEMQLMASRASVAPMMNASGAATAFGNQMVNRFGSKWGGAIGAGLGAAGGGLGGASLGYSIGDFVGSALGNIPVAGDILSWTVGQVHREAAQQLSQGFRLQYGTMGQVNMGQRDMGLGGRGMSVQAATSLAGRFQDYAEQSGGKKFNTNDLINVTSASAESGLLSGAVNTDQVFEKVKRVMGLVGQVARLTGDPDFRANVRAIGDMVRSGVSLQDVPQIMGSMNNYARMAGMTRGQAGAYGQQGAAMFAQAGLTTGLGQQVGVHSAAMGNLTQGVFDPVTANLLGGQEGITQRFTESSAAFLSGAGNMLLPYLAQQGKGGRLQINQQRLQGLMSGDINLSSVIGQGTANMSDPKMQRQLLINRRRLLSELGQQAGPMGVQGLQLNLAMGLTNQGMDLESAAVAMAGGDVMQGSMLYQTWTSSEFQDRWKAGLGESRRRTEFEGRRRAATRREEAPGWFSRRVWNPIGNALSGPDIKGGRGSAEAREEARRLQEEEDARFGIKRVYGPGLSISKEEQQIAAGMTLARPWEDSPSELESEAVLRAETGDNPFLRGAKMLEHLGQVVGEIASTPFHGYAGVGGEKAFRAREQKWTRTRSGRLSSSASAFSKVQAASSVEWFGTQRTAAQKLGFKEVDQIERIALRIAKEKGKDEAAVTIEHVLPEVRRVLGDEKYNANEGLIRTTIAGFLARSGDADVKRAVLATQDASGVLRKSYSVEEAQKKHDEAISQYEEALIQYNISGPEELSAQDREDFESFIGFELSKKVTGGEQARVTKFLKAGAEAQTGAVMLGQGRERFLAWSKGKTAEEAAAAEELYRSTGKVARGIGTTLAGKGITSAEGIQKSIASGLRGKGALGGLGKRAEAEYYRTHGGETLVDVEQGGAVDAQTQKQLSLLNREEQILIRWADAADRITQTASSLEGVVRAAMPKPAMPPTPTEN